MGDLIDAHANFVAHAVGRYIDLAPLRTATEDIRQRPETFERIAELPPTGRDIIRLIGDAHGIIQAPLQRLHGEARAIVLHTQRVGLVIRRDGDHGRTVGLFGGIEGIVQEFFEDGERPAVAAHPELHRELTLGKKFQRATDLKGGTGQGRVSHVAPPRYCQSAWASVPAL